MATWQHGSGISAIISNIISEGISWQQRGSVCGSSVINGVISAKAAASGAKHQQRIGYQHQQQRQCEAAGSS